MNEIWTFDRFPNEDELPHPFTVYIDQTTDPITVRTSPMPEPATIAGADYRRLLDLCFRRADRFSLHRCGYPGARPGALEQALRPFLAGEYRSYACVHVYGEQYWEKCCLYRAGEGAKEIILGYLTELFGREPDGQPQELPAKYRAYEAERAEAEKRWDGYMDRAGDDLSFEEMDAFEEETFREAKRLWREVFDPADFCSHMEDLCFFRGRDAFLETVTHEGLCFARVQDPQFAQALRELGPWTDGGRRSGGELFSLDDQAELVEYP